MKLLDTRTDKTLATASVRPLCLRCRRPQTYCYCERIVPIASRTRVVLLQHPREMRMAVGTARMAHLALPNSELHVGVHFGDHPRLQQLAGVERERTAVLFPGEGARDASSLQPGEIENLVVIDGTWPQARKLLRENPVLQSLPRVGFTPRKPGNYRIRKEPEEHCVATIEAVVEALGLLEGEPDRFTPMLGAFEYMVDRQLDAVANRTGPSRYVRERPMGPPPWRTELESVLSRLVLVHAEVNAHSRSQPVPGRPELVQLAAERWATGERFEALIRPRRPLAPSTPFHAGVEAEALLSAPEVQEALAGWSAWLREDDLLACWGTFAPQQLVEEGFPSREPVDLRLFVTRALDRKAGAPGDALQALEGAATEPWAHGRAGQVLAKLHGVISALRAHSPIS